MPRQLPTPACPPLSHVTNPAGTTPQQGRRLDVVHRVVYIFALAVRSHRWLGNNNERYSGVMGTDEELAQWLASLGLQQYTAAFAAHDVGWATLPLLTDDDLKELGLSLGHRRLLQQALRQRQAVPPGTVTLPSSQPPARGERRQITVLFCDLVGSTEWSHRLDPEDLRNLIHAYYSSCCRIIEQSGGFIARVIGDGILAYFGYPAAREDAAECAIRAGLRVVDAVSRENHAGAGRLEVRIGLATGLSVVSDMVGVGFSELHAVMGQTPNLAARIQALGAPGTVAIADDTRRVAGGFFVYGDLGLHELKGFAQPVQVWRVVGESQAGARYDAQHAARAECIGREVQLELLQSKWDAVRSARYDNAVVTLFGEPGIGKSRLMRTASERLIPQPTHTVLMQCSPSQVGTPLHPVVDWLRREITTAPGTDDHERLRSWLGSDARGPELALMAEFLSIPVPAGEAPAPMPPDRKRQLTRDILVRHVQARCAEGAVLWLVEDAHWMDGATEDFLVALFSRLRREPLMALITTRPERSYHWAEAHRCTDVVLYPLARADAQRLLDATCRGRPLPDSVREKILARTDGVPLFIEELTTTVLEGGFVRQDGDGWVVEEPLPALDIPTTLRDSLMARLDRLNDIKDVACVASVLGREFTFALLAHVSSKPTHQLVAALDRLVEARLLFQRGVPPDAEYIFKHALIQQAAYDSQLRSDRRALHARIVAAIEAHQPELARREPGWMAHHCELAGLVDRSVDYLRAAGVASTRIVAIPEALSYFQRADAAMSTLEPSAANARRHIDIILGLMEVGRFAILPSRLRELSARARELSSRDGVQCDASVTAAILFQDARAKLYCSYYDQARSIFHELRALGRTHGSEAIERKPASALCMNLCCQGLFGEMLEFVHEDNIGYYQRSGSTIDYISGLGWIGYARAQAGAVPAGLAAGDLSVREAEQFQSPVYLAGAYVWRSHAHMAARRLDQAIDDARRCVDLATTHAMPYLAWHGLVFLALCLCRRGDIDGAAAALVQARQLLAQVEDGRWSLMDYLPAIEAEIACARGDHAAALQCADEAVDIARSIGGVHGEAIAQRAAAVSLLRASGDVERAQARFDRAMALHAQGDAHAERTYGALLWGHELHRAGLAQRAAPWLAEARALAQLHGYELNRCEYDATVAL